MNTFTKLFFLLVVQTWLLASCQGRLVDLESETKEATSSHANADSESQPIAQQTPPPPVTPSSTLTAQSSWFGSPYIGIAGGYSQMNPVLSNSSWQIDKSNDIGYQVYLGSKFSKSWSAELAYHNLGGVSIKDGSGTNLGKLNYSAVTLGVLYSPIMWGDPHGFGVAPFMGLNVRYGDTQWNGDSGIILNTGDIADSVSGGLNMPIASNWGLRLTYDRYSKDTQMLSLGLHYGANPPPMTAAIAPPISLSSSTSYPQQPDQQANVLGLQPLIATIKPSKTATSSAQVVIAEQLSIENNAPDDESIQTVYISPTPDDSSKAELTEDGFLVRGLPRSDIESYLKRVTNPPKAKNKIFRGHVGPIYSVAYHPNGNTILSAGKDSTLIHWDNATGKILNVLKGHKSAVRSVDISQDGNYALSGSWDNNLILWNLKTASILKLMTGHQDIVFSVKFSPNGKIAASTSCKKRNSRLDCTLGEIKLWKIPDGTLIQTIRVHSDWINDIAFSDNSKRLVSVSRDKTIKIWKIQYNPVQVKLLKTIEKHQLPVNKVNFTSNGQIFATMSADRTLRLWNIVSGAEIGRINMPKTINAIRLSPNKMHLLASSCAAYDSSENNCSQGEVTLWDINKKLAIRTFTGHSDIIRDIDFSPNGEQAVTVGLDSAVYVWDIYPDRKIRVKYNQPIQLSIQSRKTFNQILERYNFDFVAKPPLNDSPITKKEVFESRQEYRQRQSIAQHHWEDEIFTVQRTFRQQVERRNYGLLSLQQELPLLLRKTIASEFVKVFGLPMIKAVKFGALPKYNAEIHKLSVDLYFSNIKSEDFLIPLTIVFDNNFNGRQMYELIEQGDMPVQAHFTTDENGNLYFKNITLEGNESSYSGYYTQRKSIADYPIHIDWNNLNQLAFRIQNPNLKDSLENQNMKLIKPRDDIPLIYEKTISYPGRDNRWLFVIGAEKYHYTNNVPYAKRSAEWFVKIISDRLGIKRQRQLIMLNDQGNTRGFREEFRFLLSRVQDKDVIYFYFVGHGLSDQTEARHPYILPIDVVPDFISEHPLFSLHSIIDYLGKSKAKKILMFTDTCFSGQSDGRNVYLGSDENYLPSDQNLYLNPKGKVSLISACGDNQYAQAYYERGHRLFSYYLIRQLLGKNRTMKQLTKDITKQIYRNHNHSKRLGIQTPVLQGNPNLMLD